MQRTAPVTARLRHRFDAPSVIETAPMARIGDNGRSQKQATLRMASSLPIRPGAALGTKASMRQAPEIGTAILLMVGTSYDVCQPDPSPPDLWGHHPARV